MKIKLLFLFCTLTLLIQAQAPINNYFSVPMSEFAIVSGTIDQSPTGANATWVFGTLIQSGTNTDTYASPTAAELTSYPGTTQVLTVFDGTSSTQGFYKVVGSTLSLTGATNPDFTLDYNTDNALVGTYPLTFGSPVNNDAIAGQIAAQGFNEAYTGMITTEVEAHGVLSFDITGLGAYSGNVTRIQTDQVINFVVAGFFPGTATITNYNYYKDIDGALVFRTTDGVVDVPGIFNQTITSKEALITNTLSVNDNELLENTIKLYPNPVADVLHIQLNASYAIQSVKIMDMQGRTVLTSKGIGNTINMSQLQAGLYTLTVSTDIGTVTRKFIKK